MAFVLKATQQVPLTLAIKDKFGNPASIDGVPVWASSDETILTVAPAADGMSAVATPVGPAGSAQVNVSADADTGSGSKEITGLLAVDVVAGDATVVELQAGTPTDV
jgi:hypothetical protein